MKTLILLFLVSCASSLMPANERSTTILHSNGLSKKDNYNNALELFSESFNDSTKVIKLVNADTGTIILKGSIECNIFRQSGDFQPYYLSFSLKFKASNNQVKLRFRNMSIVNSMGKAVAWDYNQLSSKDKVNKAKTCLMPLVDKEGKWNIIGGSEIGVTLRIMSCTPIIGISNS